MKVLIIDDHPLMQHAVGNVLRAIDPQVELVVTETCDRALEIAAGPPEPDLVLLDLHLPGVSGIPALKLWRSRFPAVPVMILTAQDDPQTMLAAMAAGAAGYVPKSTSSEIIQHAVSLVLSGGKYLPPELLSRRGAQASHCGEDRAPVAALGLSARQAEVLRLVARGATNKVICRELGLAERTVKAHITAVFRSLKVSTRTQAALEAVKLGLA
jgi:DNA-binding NarL/FixJ family response regulator